MNFVGLVSVAAETQWQLVNAEGSIEIAEESFLDLYHEKENINKNTGSCNQNIALK